MATSSPPSTAGPLRFDDEWRGVGMNGSSRRVLVADLGASSLRLALIDESGTNLGFAARPLDTDSPAPGRREQDPDEWWRQFLVLTGEVFGDNAAPPEAVVISGGTRTQVLVGTHGESLRPAIMWDDSRALAEARRLAQRFPLDGNPITPFHPAARLAWLSRHEPEATAAARAVLQPKDFLVRRLTGEAVSDPVSNWMLLGPGDTYLSEVVEAAAFDPLKLPAMAEPGAVVGHVLAGDGIDPRLVGVPVLCGAMDAWCCALALGAYAHGARYNLSGTSEVVGVISSQRRVVDGILTVPWGDGLWHLGGPSQCGGRTVNWARGILGMTDGTIDGHVGASGGVGDGPLFIPYLDGERTPWWDAALTGAWFELRSGHRRADLLLAVIEGIAFHVRVIIEAARSGATAPPIRIGGGLARSDTWCQTRADVLGEPVVRTGADEPGLAGAAMIAMTALRWCESFDDARERVAADTRRFEPRPGTKAAVDARYKRFLDFSASSRSS